MSLVDYYCSKDINEKKPNRVSSIESKKFTQMSYDQNYYREFFQIFKQIKLPKKCKKWKKKNPLLLIQYDGYRVENLTMFLGQVPSNSWYEISFSLGAVFTWKPGYSCLN